MKNEIHSFYEYLLFLFMEQISKFEPLYRALTVRDPQIVDKVSVAVRWLEYCTVMSRRRVRLLKIRLRLIGCFLSVSIHGTSDIKKSVG